MKILVCLVCLVCFKIFLFAELSVIVSKDNKLNKVSNKELSKVYLKKTNEIQGNKVTPVDNNGDYQQFYKKVIKKNPSQIHAYWMKQIFIGKKRPPKKISNDNLLSEMEKDSSIIGYSSQKLNAKVVYETK